MMRITKTMRKLGMTAALAVSATFAAPASADVIQLGFILDESGSIGASNYTIIKNGLANAINSLIPTNGTYEISVIAFASSAQTVVNHVLIDSAAARTAVANAIIADPYAAGSTFMAPAFNAMTAALSGSTQTVTASYVNFATDGVNSDSDATVIAARNALLANGVDNLSIEAIGSGVDSGFLQGQICSPQPCDSTAPYNFPGQGFYIAVADAQGYANAISNKIRVVTNQVPEPGTLALFGLALAGLGLGRRKQA